MIKHLFIYLKVAFACDSVCVEALKLNSSYYIPLEENHVILWIKTIVSPCPLLFDDLMASVANQ